VDLQDEPIDSERQLGLDDRSAETLRREIIHRFKLHAASHSDAIDGRIPIRSPRSLTPAGPAKGGSAGHVSRAGVPSKYGPRISVRAASLSFIGIRPVRAYGCHRASRPILAIKPIPKPALRAATSWLAAT
jgi:hypothetical protein